MHCCQCDGIESAFNEARARQDIARYHKNGPSKSTRLLLQALKSEEIDGMTLLDIGGGVGVIQYELLRVGMSRATSVEASQAFLQVARAEAARQHLAERITWHHGNFVALAPEISPADIVTLDRVLCCYPDMVGLVECSVARAEKFYGLVYPRDRWWVKALLPLLNLYFWLQRTPFRLFVHATAHVEQVICQQGFKRHFYQVTPLWQVVVYQREGRAGQEEPR